MTVHHTDERVTLHHGDCLDVLAELPGNSIDAIVTDPPYGLANTSPAQVADTITRWVNGDRDYLPGGAGFMGKAWDAFVPPVAVWDEALRVLKPGGHLLAFAGSRTFDLMALGIRLAGFDVRDSIAWLYGSGFPKSLDVSKAIDRAAGAERAVIGPGRWNHVKGNGDQSGCLIRPGGKHDETAPATDVAARWQGWGTALKPAFEPVVLARKPLTGTVAANVQQWGTGALNIDACRIATDDTLTGSGSAPLKHGGMNSRPFHAAAVPRGVNQNPSGRWPANVALDESQAAALDQQSGESSSTSGGRSGSNANPMSWTEANADRPRGGHDDSGGASRFYFTAKAPTAERPRHGTTAHPTVKPLDLMRWLVRLVTPPGGTVLDPFAGSGTTLEAALLEGFQSIGIEREADYLPLILQRIHRRRDPITYLRHTGDDLALFDLEDPA